MWQRLKSWFKKHLVMEMTPDCNDGSWESGFYSDDAGIRSVEKIDKIIAPNMIHSWDPGPRIDRAILEHDMTMVMHDMDNVSYLFPQEPRGKKQA